MHGQQNVTILNCSLHIKRFVTQEPKSGIGHRIVEAHTQLDNTQTPGSTPLDEWSARRRGRYLHNTRITYMISPPPPWRCGPTRAMASSFTRFLDHTQRRTTVGRTPLDEWSARRRNLYLTTHNTHNRQTSMPPAGFELTISAGKRRQTYVLDRAATGIGTYMNYMD